MSGFSVWRYLAFLLVLLVVQSVMLLWHGLLMITVHEGDAMHTVQILLRMEMGQVPHVDFLTPIGVMAFAPIVLFLGYGVGKAILMANILMAALAIPALCWIAMSRLSGGLSYILGAGVIILMTAMVHGEPVQVTSISMYYNRWAWGAAFLVVLVAVLPTRERNSQIADGIVLGLGLSFLALTKMTYFVSLAPAVAAALLLRQHWQSLFVTVIVGALSMLVVSLLAGFGFWSAYLSDLLVVNNAGVRNAPSNSLLHLLIGPRYVLLNILLLLSVILVRQSGKLTEGIVLLMLAPAFVFITYQNWGNDPQWLFVLGVLLLALRPHRSTINAWGWDVRVATGTVAILCFALITPSAFNILLSTSNHMQLRPAEFSVLLKDPRHSNLVVQTKLLYAPEIRTEITLPDEKMAALGRKFSARRDYSLYQEQLEFCKLHRGLGGMMQLYARELDALGYMKGKSVYVADLLSNLWLFGDTVPIERGSPWYYGGDTGLGRADYLLVPFCPNTAAVWALVLDELAAEDSPKFSTVHRNEHFVLLRRDKL